MKKAESAELISCVWCMTVSTHSIEPSEPALEKIALIVVRRLSASVSWALS